MEDFQTQVTLVYTAEDLHTNRYYLHSITTANQANYRAGTQPQIVLQNDGTIDVELQVVEDNSIPEIHMATPIVHTVNVGTFAPNAYHQINVSVVLVSGGISSTIGDDVLSTAEAMEDSKPIEIGGS